MLKLRTILDLQETIYNQNILLNTLIEDYLQLIDDDLFTVDFTAEPSFVSDMKLTFTTSHQLKQKYLLRFCDDFGLTLISEEKTNDTHYTYLFKCKEI